MSRDYKFALFEEVLGRVYDVEADSEIPAGTSITALYDAEFPVEPDIEAITTDAGEIAVTSITKFKDRVKIKLGSALPAGKSVRVRIKPKRVL